MTPRRVLVTGGCGFIGSTLVRHLLRERPGLEIVNLDLLTYAGDPRSLGEARDHPRHRLVHADVRDPRAVRTAMAGCDAVIHLAAESHVDRSIRDASPFVATNVLGTQVILDAARELAGDGRRMRVVHVSTDEVYGDLPLDRPDLRFTEDSPLRPSSPYAASKAAADLLVLAAHRTHGLDAIVTRCSNNYGPHQFPEKVIPLFATNLLEGRRVPLYGDGRNVRDWLHVEDHCAALLAILERGTAGAVYNVGGDNERSNLELTHALLAAAGRGPEMIERVPDRPGHDRRYAIDATRLRTELGWRPARTDWSAALAETVAWYRDNDWWWRPLKGAAAGCGLRIAA